VTQAFTRPATWDDVLAIVRALEREGAKFALVGGYAIAAQGFNRFSEDIDILVEPTAANSVRWIAALSTLPDGAARELAHAPDVFANDTLYAIRINDEITIDVMPSIAGYRWEEMVPHIETKTVQGVSVPLLNLEGLLKTKQGMRPKDQMDAVVLRAAIERLK
jgi:hypothetical protein